MELDFDKEIDALLRQSAHGETAFAATNLKSLHLDADEISAFAENALPEKTRHAYTVHLADCERCRKILSNIISLNSDAESEIVHAAQESRQIVALPIPWYRKLVAFPNLAYTLGALVLVFSGIAAFTVLQSVKNSGSAEVSQVSERQPNGKGMSSDGAETAAESSSNSMMANSTSMNSDSSTNSASMNSASNKSASVPNPAMPSAPPGATAANTNAMATRDEADKELKAAPKPTEQQNKPVDLAKTEDSIVAGSVSPSRENNNQVEREPAKQHSNTGQSSINQNQGGGQSDLRRVQNAPSPAMRADTKSKKIEESKDDAREKSAETTTVGGKTFKRASNVWIDSAYRGGATTNITRGTKEYKKLDSGLRVIVENLGGTVVVVWKEKAYRIQ